MLNIVLAPLALAAKTFPVGSAIRVTVSFAYTTGAATKLTLRAGPYYTNTIPPFKHLVDACVGSSEIILPVAMVPTAAQATVDFLLVPKSQNGIEDGTYGLRVWIDGTTATAAADNALVATGNPTAAPGICDSLMAMMPMLMMVMMLGMVMPMMQGFGGGEETE